MATITGGRGLSAVLDNLVRQIENAGTLYVGFLETEKYPDGTPVAQIAYQNEFGAIINVEAKQTTIYRSVASDGSFNKNGRFVKRSASNFATTHAVAAHQINIPSRPFFRQMIATKQSGWGVAFGRLAVANNYNFERVLALMGEGIKDQLTKSIIDFDTPPNAKSTIRKKGFNNPLIETGQMQRAVGYEVRDE